MIRHRAGPPTSFDTETGILIRSGDQKPNSPELIDLKVTTICHADCAFCYMSALPEGEHADLAWIKAQISSLPEPPFEIAIGGGEPTAWPDLIDFVHWCREQGIVPNAAVGPAADAFVVKEIVKKGMMGSLGVSVVPGMMGSLEMLRIVKNHSEIPIRAHCIIRKDWVEIWKGMAGILPTYVDGVVFLNFKPHGRAENRMDLQPTIIDIQDLFETYRSVNLAVGFDSCSSCALKHIVPEELLDECDGGKYSMFIDGVAQEFSACSFLPGTPFGDIMLNAAWDSMAHIPTCKFAAKKME